MITFFEIIIKYIYANWKFIFFTSLIFIVISSLIIFILWVIISYYILTRLKKNVDEYLYSNSHRRSCKKILEKYGDLKIKNIYLVRQPLSPNAIFLLNLLSFNQWSKHFKTFIKKEKCPNFSPIHASIMIDVQLKNKYIKTISLEKNSGIEIRTNFKIYENQDKLKINIKDEFTINKLLEITEKRIGKHKFYNWELFKNNCQQFSLEILKSVKKNNKKYIKFIDQSHFLKTMKNNFYGDIFKLYLLHFCINFWSILKNFTY